MDKIATRLICNSFKFQVAKLIKFSDSARACSFSQTKVTISSDSKSSQKTSVSVQQTSSIDTMTAIIYTDGACKGNGQPGARAGIGVYWPQNPHLNLSLRLFGPQTNQRAEIMAVIMGVQQVLEQQRYNRVHVYTDSHYVKKAAETWMSNWDVHGWHNVANKDLFERLRDLMGYIDTTFEYVPSKDNHADPLARQGADLPYR